MNNKKVFFSKVVKSSTSNNYCFKASCSDVNKLCEFRDEVYYSRKDVIV